MAPRGARARRRARGRRQHRLARGADRRRARRRLALRPRDRATRSKAATTAARSRPPAASPRRCRCWPRRSGWSRPTSTRPDFRFDAAERDALRAERPARAPVAGAEPAVPPARRLRPRRRRPRPRRRRRPGRAALDLRQHRALPRARCSPASRRARGRRSARCSTPACAQRPHRRRGLSRPLGERRHAGTARRAERRVARSATSSRTVAASTSVSEDLARTRGHGRHPRVRRAGSGGERRADLVDARQHLGRQLRQHVDRARLSRSWRQLRGAGDHGADARVLRHPGDRQLRDAAAELGGDRLELARRLRSSPRR